jgi:hypothetical protein
VYSKFEGEKGVILNASKTFYDFWHCVDQTNKKSNKWNKFQLWRTQSQSSCETWYIIILHVMKLLHTVLLLSSKLKVYENAHYPLQRTNHWRLAEIRSKICIIKSR